LAPARWEGDPPPKNQPLKLTFFVEGVQPGPGEVHVFINQGSMQLARLDLKPTITANPVINSSPLVAAAAPADPGPVQQVPMLQIFEREEGTKIVYDFNLVVGPNQVPIMARGQPLKQDRQDYVSHLYAQIEEFWSNNKDDQLAFTHELRAFGAQLLDTLVPPSIQAKLWDLRNSMSGMIVYSYEPFIPWELIHLKQPAVPGQPTPGLPAESLFLGELGITRWLVTDDNNNPPVNIRVRPGRSHYVIPDYPPADWRLPQAQLERPFLEQKLHAAEVPGDPAKVRALLESTGSFDLFHFAGHGFAENKNIASAQIMVLGRIEPGKYIPRYYSASNVEQGPVLTGADGNRPLIILNACQVGRNGYQLTQVGGFSKAFISRRAGAFVAPLWSVGDHPARNFTEALYAALLAGDTLAEASRKAHKVAKAAGDATWMAYSVYGNPMLTLSVSP